MTVSGHLQRSVQQPKQGGIPEVRVSNRCLKSRPGWAVYWSRSSNSLRIQRNNWADDRDTREKHQMTKLANWTAKGLCESYGKQNTLAKEKKKTGEQESRWMASSIMSSSSSGGCENSSQQTDSWRGYSTQAKNWHHQKELTCMDELFTTGPVIRTNKVNRVDSDFMPTLIFSWKL